MYIGVRKCLLSFGAEFLSSRLLSKNLKNKIFRTVILPVILYGCETWFVDTAGGKEAEGVWEQGVEENIWTYEGRGNGGIEEIA